LKLRETACCDYSRQSRSAQDKQKPVKEGLQNKSAYMLPLGDKIENGIQDILLAGQVNIRVI
jgi:hypothetical protein